MVSAPLKDEKKPLTRLLRLVHARHVGTGRNAAHTARPERTAQAAHRIVATADRSQRHHAAGHHLRRHLLHEGRLLLLLVANGSANGHRCAAADAAHDLLTGMHLHNCGILRDRCHIVDHADVLDVAAAEQNVIVHEILRRNRELRFAFFGAIRTDCFGWIDIILGY